MKYIELKLLKIENGYVEYNIKKQLFISTVFNKMLTRSIRHFIENASPDELKSAINMVHYRRSPYGDIEVIERLFFTSCSCPESRTISRGYLVPTPDDCDSTMFVRGDSSNSRAKQYLKLSAPIATFHYEKKCEEFYNKITEAYLNSVNVTIQDILDNYTKLNFYSQNFGISWSNNSDTENTLGRYHSRAKKEFGEKE